MHPIILLYLSDDALGSCPFSAVKWRDIVYVLQLPFFGSRCLLRTGFPGCFGLSVGDLVTVTLKFEVINLATFRLSGF